MPSAEEISAVFEPQRLRLARFRAGLTIRDLADSIAVTPAAVSQFESGSSRPTATTLAKIAISTGVPVTYFAHGRRPVSSTGLNDTHFRSLRSTSKRDRARSWAWSETALDVADTLERFVQLPEVDVPVIPVDDDDGLEQAAESARQLRRDWNLPEGPLGHLVRQMEAHGIVVAKLEIATSKIDAFSHWQAQRPVVILGTDKDDLARSRFDTAHELGHLVCHPDAEPGGVQEQQAHAFAAELLMPREHMIQLLPRRFDLGTYGKLKQDWGVSIAALLYQSRLLEVISEAAYRRAVVMMNQRYGRRNEPFPVVAPETPTLLATAANVAAEHGITLEQIADEACLPVEQVVTIVGLPDQRPMVVLQ